MHVTFGLFLDARQGPSPTNFFNSPVVGRLGFLSLLETYLGLSAPEVSTAKRVAVYSGLLRAHDNSSRFYSESLQADSIGTAARLLAWRDEWRLGGWDGSAHGSYAASRSTATPLAAPLREAANMRHGPFSTARRDSSCHASHCFASSRSP